MSSPAQCLTRPPSNAVLIIIHLFLNVDYWKSEIPIFFKKSRMFLRKKKKATSLPWISTVTARSPNIVDGLNRWSAIHRVDTAHLHQLALEKGTYMPLAVEPHSWSCRGSHDIAQVLCKTTSSQQAYWGSNWPFLAGFVFVWQIQPRASKLDKS